MTDLSDIWPPLGLTLTTPRLVLRPIRDDDIPAAIEAALSGISEPGRSPFSTPWNEFPAEKLAPNMAQWYWRCRAGVTPEAWTMLLGVWHDGQIIGCQDIEAKDFGILRTVTTGSWLRKSVHGRGMGKEMRAAVVSYAFDYLKAEVAESEAAAWNEKSLGVSRSLGYELNGVARRSWAGIRQDVQMVRVTPESFKRPDWTLKVEGQEATAKYLGL
jgi:RimJ/RimL family protein N-acetyltransferase